MLNPLISFAVGVVVTLLFSQVFGRVVYGIIPGIFAMLGTFIYLGYRIVKDMQARSTRVQEILTPRNNAQPNPARVKKAIDDAVDVLKGALMWKKWQPFVVPQINAQIGMLYYQSQRFEESRRYLESSTKRSSMAMALLGALRFQDNDVKGMTEAFELAVKHGKKDSLVWNAYAWCLTRKGDKDGAILVLNRAMEHVKTDERTQRNLDALRNGKSIKMKGWTPHWYIFHLEKPPVVAPQSPIGRKHQRAARRAMRGR